MARYGVTLTANTNDVSVAADSARMNVAIINGSSTDTVFVEFGAVADTTVATGCWRIPPLGSLFLNSGEWPEIRNSINCKSTGTPPVAIRTNT